MKTFVLTMSALLLSAGVSLAQVTPATPAGKLNETPVERPVPRPSAGTAPASLATPDPEVLNQATIDQRTTEERVQDGATVKKTEVKSAVGQRTTTKKQSTTKPRPVMKKTSSSSKTTTTTTRP